MKTKQKEEHTWKRHRDKTKQDHTHGPANNNTLQTIHAREDNTQEHLARRYEHITKSVRETIDELAPEKRWLKKMDAW